MKRIGNIAATLLTAVALGASSCDVLDLDATDRFTPTTVWSDQYSVDQYVIGFYSTFMALSDINARQTQFTDTYSDLIKSSSWNQYSHGYNQTLLQTSSFNSNGAGPFEHWEANYKRIRLQNEFLRDVKVYGTHLGDQFIRQRTGEVLFCRAYTYMDLLKIYGCDEKDLGVLLREQVDGPEQNDKARASFEESWDLVIKDLKYAAENLPDPSDPDHGWPDSQYGRATKSAALGLLTRAGLYAKRWDVVIEAANKLKELGRGLVTGDPNTAYASVFNNATVSKSNEILFAVCYHSADKAHSHDIFFRPLGDKKIGNRDMYAAFGPTSELVDCFEMADGKPFNWETHKANPYENREPRFYATVLYNGAQWEGRTIETFVGGADGLKEFETQGASGSTSTGYYFRKFLTEGDRDWVTTGSSHFMPVCRYAEVLLNKAEALAEKDFAANKAEALAALNEVRARVGLPAKDAANKEEFDKILRHERIVELAGEGFRFWDIRRWKIGMEVINGQACHGVKITKNGDSFTYSQIEVDAGRKRHFEERYNAFSIPISERANNPLFGENNPGW